MRRGSFKAEEQGVIFQVLMEKMVQICVERELLCAILLYSDLCQYPANGFHNLRHMSPNLIVVQV